MPDTILLVDDNALNRKLLRLILEYSGYAILEAGNGERGLQMIKALLPAMVLMDVQMPGMDGICALKAILADATTCHIPVVAVTSYAMKGDRQRLLGEGFADYIAKPINKDELLAKVATIVEGRQR